MRAPTFILIGDSQAAGLQQPLLERLARLGWAFLGASTHVGWSVGRTVSGQEVAEISRTLPEVAIIVYGGSNDTSDTTNLTDKIRMLLEQIRRSAEPRIVWIGPSHSDDAIVQVHKQRVAAIQRAAAGKYGFEWHDGSAMTSDLPHTVDDVHFPQRSQERWADRIVAALQQNRRSTWAGVALGIGAVAAAAGLVWATGRTR